MESFIGHIQKKNTRAESSREIDMCNTAGTGVRRQGLTNIYENTTWIFRLEWQC